MAQRCRDLFAWMRAFTGSNHLPATTRLVLFSHMRFMNREGGSCWVGVRRLAEAAGLDKGTVAKHRQAAIVAGWLIASPHSRYSRSRSFEAAIPDELAAQFSADAKGLPSDLAVQSKVHAARRLYGRNASSVRSERTDRPAAPYESSPTSQYLQNRAAHGNARVTEEASAELIAWLLRSDLGKRYAHDPDALNRLTPLALRFSGYESVIRQVIEEST
jgi:hypothetical protein